MARVYAVLHTFVLVLSAFHVSGKVAITKETTQSAYVESSIHLGASNWTTSIKDGLWFIEFYTPFSQSCKDFAPTWQELCQNKETLRTTYPTAPFSIAQVDCSIDRELCVQEEVKHVPRLTLYRDGVLKESEYTGEREYTALSAYIDEHAQSYRTFRGSKAAPQGNANEVDVIGPAPAPKPDVAPFKAAGKLEDHAAKVDADAGVPVQDAAAAGNVKGDEKKVEMEQQAPEQRPATAHTGPTKPNPNGQVLIFGKDENVIDEETLQNFLSRDAGVGASFVKFFAPWCPHCRAMAGAYTRVAEAVRDQVNVIEVNCEVYRSTCAKYNIKSFPTLRMYNEGEKVDYTGGRSFDAMRNWALKVGGASGMRKIEAKELDDIARDNEVFFLYLHGSKTSDAEITTVIRAARTLLTKTAHAFRSSSPELILRYQRFLHGLEGSAASSSGLLVFKNHNVHEPAAYFTASKQKGEESTERSIEISTWLDLEHYPSIIELTGTSFNEIVRNPHGAPIILAALSDEHHSGNRQGTGTGAILREKELDAFRDFVSQWQMRATKSHDGEEDILSGRKVLFAWIDADRWATAVRKYFDVTVDQFPKLILTDGARLKHYHLPSGSVDNEESARSWLKTDRIMLAVKQIGQGKGPSAKSSATSFWQTTAREPTSFVESMLLWVSHHFFTSVLLTIAFVALMVTYLRYQAAHSARYGAAGQRLPLYGGKAD